MGPHEPNAQPPPRSVVRGRTELPLPEHLILFDGTCGLCERAVQNLLSRDQDRILRYAPLQGTLAASLRQRFPDQIPIGLETVVYVDSSGPQIQIWTRSRAALRVLETLGGNPLSVCDSSRGPGNHRRFFLPDDRKTPLQHFWPH